MTAQLPSSGDRVNRTKESAEAQRWWQTLAIHNYTALGGCVLCPKNWPLLNLFGELHIKSGE